MAAAQNLKALQMAEQLRRPHVWDAAEHQVQVLDPAFGPSVVAAATKRMALIWSDARSERKPIMFVNDSFLALTGFSREAVLGRDLALLLGDFTDRAALSSILVSLKSGADGNWQSQCRRADGSEFLAAIYLSPVHDDQEVVCQHFLSVVELGDQLDGPLTQRNQLHALYEKAPGFIATFQGPEHRFTFANASYDRLVGSRRLIGLKLAEAVPEIADPSFIDRLDDVFRTGEPFVGTEIPMTLIDPEGRPSQHYVDFVYQPVRSADDRITGLFCEGFNVTEQKIARDKVLALQSDLLHLSGVSAMETLATTLAHELNQPLAAIVNYTAGARRLIQADTVSPHQLVELLQLIGDSAERAGEIIRHLRSLTDREPPFRSVFDLQDVIGTCIRLAKLGGCENVDIVDAGRMGITLEGDPIQIQQVIINLLRNACEASIAAGNRSVGISTSVSGNIVTVAVRDSGAGVPANIVRAGFRRTSNGKPDGMGVGLSIARTIVDAHDGVLWLESSGAEGSSFAFSLPRIAKPA